MFRHKKIRVYDNFSGFYTMLRRNIQLIEFLLFALTLSCNNSEVDNKINPKDPHLNTVLKYAREQFAARYRITIAPQKRCDKCEIQLNETLHCAVVDSKIYCGAPGNTNGCATTVVKEKKFIKCINIPIFYFVNLENLNKDPNSTIEYLQGLYEYAANRYNTATLKYDKERAHMEDTRERAYMEDNFSKLGPAITKVCGLLREECVSGIEIKLKGGVHKITKEQLHSLYIDKITALSMIDDNTMLWQILLILSCANTNQIGYINKKEPFEWRKFLDDEYNKISKSGKESKKELEDSLSLSDTVLNDYPLYQLMEDLSPLLTSQECLNPYVYTIIAHAFKTETSYDTESLKTFLMYTRESVLTEFEENSLKELIARFKVGQNTIREKSRKFLPQRAKISLLGSIDHKNARHHTERYMSEKRFINPCNTGRESTNKGILAPFYKEEFIHNEIGSPRKKSHIEPIRINADRTIEPKFNNAQPPRLNFSYSSFNGCSTSFPTMLNPSFSTELKREAETSIPMKTNNQLSSNIGINYNYTQFETPDTTSSFALNNSNGYEKPEEDLYTDPFFWKRLGLEMPKSMRNHLCERESVEKKVCFPINFVPNRRSNSFTTSLGISSFGDKETETPYNCPIRSNYSLFNPREISLLDALLGPNYDNELATNPTLLGNLLILKGEQSEPSMYNKEYYAAFLDILKEFNEKTNSNSSHIASSAIEKLNVTETDLSKSGSVKYKIQSPIAELNEIYGSAKKREIGKISNKKAILKISEY